MSDETAKDDAQPSQSTELATPAPGLPTPDTVLPTPDTGLPTPDTGLPIPDSVQPIPATVPPPLGEVTAESVPHALGWSRLRRLAIALSVVILSIYVTDRGLVRWISWTAEVAAEMDGAVADLRLHVADPPQERWDDGQARLVIAWDPSDPRCTQRLQQTQRWIRAQPADRDLQVGWMVLPTADDAGDDRLSTALVALHSRERLLDWLAQAPKDQAVTVEMLRKVAAIDEREAAIFDRQMADTEVQLAARTWARMAQGLGLGRCGARLDGWLVGDPGTAGDPAAWQGALEKIWRQMVALHGGPSLDPRLSQLAALRAAHLEPAMAARWQRWIIKHQRFGNRMGDNGDAIR